MKSPKLYKKREEGKEEEGQKQDTKGDVKNQASSDKVEPPKQVANKGDGFIEQRRKNARRKQPTQQIWRANTQNKFANLENKEGKEEHQNKGQEQVANKNDGNVQDKGIERKDKQTTKVWVEQTFKDKGKEATEKGANGQQKEDTGAGGQQQENVDPSNREKQLK